MYTLRFTRHTLKISNFCERVREYEWDSACKLDDVQHFCDFDNWYQLAGDCTRQLGVNVTGYTLLAQRLHMLHIGK